MKKLLTAVPLSAGMSLAAAHGGHGMSALHWHATDAWGFVWIGAAAALLIWLRRGK